MWILSLASVTSMKNKSSPNVNTKYLHHLFLLRVETQELKNYDLIESGIIIMGYKESDKQDTREKLSTDSRGRDSSRMNGTLIYLHKFAMSLVLHVVTVWGLSGNVCSGREKQLENFQSHGLASLFC